MKVNAQNVVVLGMSGTVFNVLAGVAGSYLLSSLYPDKNVDTLAVISTISFFSYSYLGVATIDSLRREFGYKSPVSFSGIFGDGIKRKIPIVYEGKKSHIFMSSLLSPPSESLAAITATINNVDYTFTASEIEQFIRLCWRRQRSGNCGLSRSFWVTNRNMKLLNYNTMMEILSPYIVDRRKGKSGKLIIPPREILRDLQLVHT